VIRARATDLPDVLVLEPEVFEDDRGFVFESYHRGEFERAVGRDVAFVQDNHARSHRNVLRGLHYRVTRPQGKLVRVARGEIFDVAVDLRRGSGTFGRWVGERLSEDDRRAMWIPEGFAHGFLVLSESADVLYKLTGHHDAAEERAIRWDDPDLAIRWPLAGPPILSDRDAAAPPLRSADPVSD